MAKVKRSGPAMDLYKAILLLRDEKECLAFFEDLCSDGEIAAIEQRFQVARMLSRDEVYSRIQEKTKAGTATVSRVNRVYSKGNGTLKEIIGRLDASEKEKQGE